MALARLARAALQTVLRSEWQGEEGLSASWLVAELQRADPASAPDLAQVERALQAASAFLKHAAYLDAEVPELEAEAARQGWPWTDEGARTAALKFWRAQRATVRDCVLARASWNNTLSRTAWRVDVKARGRGGAAEGAEAAALVELEVAPARRDAAAPPSQLVRFELNKAQLNALLAQVTAIEQAIEQAARQ